MESIKNEEQQFYDLVYFKNFLLKPLNNNMLILTIYNYYQLLICPILGTFGPVIFILIPYLILRIFYKINIALSFYYNFIKSSYLGVNDMLSSFGNNRGEKTLYGQILKIISSTFYVLFYLQGVYTTFEYARTQNNIINTIHKKLNNLAIFIKKMMN